MIYVIIAIAGGNIYASRMGWPTEELCEANLRPALIYIIEKAKDQNAIERCVDAPNASRFMVKSSQPFTLFPD